MNHRICIIFAACLLSLFSCKNQYLEDYYIEPKAAFSWDIAGDTITTLQSVSFTNEGRGQNYAIYTGDDGHLYGALGNNGFAVGANGTFSYSYREPGDYMVVWVATSMNAKGELIASIDSMPLHVVDHNGGLDNLSIYRIFRMDEYDATRNTFYHSHAQFVNDTLLLCPIIYEAWRTGKINSIKSPKLTLKYALTSSTATLTWWNQGEWKSVRSELDNIFSVMDGERMAPQRLCVTTASGYKTYYTLVAVMMPKLTSFAVNGIEGVVSHDVLGYNRYYVDITVPADMDLHTVQPVWTLMNGDDNLLAGATASVRVNGVEQISGQTTIDLTQEVVYDLSYSVGEGLTQTSTMIIRIQTTAQQ